MAGLADDWPENRQTCVAVLCAYLRMPYDDLELSAPAAERLAFLSNQQVRHTAIRVITGHLRGTTPVSWQGLKFDFKGVAFDGGDFMDATFSGGAVDFTFASFPGGWVSFEGAKFSDGAQVSFACAEFTGGEVDFDRAEFSDGAQVSFDRALVCDGHVQFNDARFSGGNVSFRYFYLSGGKVAFDEAEFSGSTVTFEGAEFRGSTVTFSSSRFSGGTVDLSCPADWTIPPEVHAPADGAPSVLKLPAVDSGELARTVISKPTAVGPEGIPD